MKKEKEIIDKTKPTWRLLYESPQDNINKLFEIYRHDRQKARIIYSQDKTKYISKRCVLFEWSNGNYKIVNILKTYGISKTSKIYHREKTVSSVLYKGNKFYYITNRKIVQLTHYSLLGFISNFCSYDVYRDNEIYKILEKRNSWLRFIDEFECFNGISFNTIISKKLYNYNSALRYLYGCPLPVAKLLHDNKNINYDTHSYIKLWKEIKDVLINIENLKIGLYSSEYFNDTCKMALSLGYKVNCSWSPNRLRVEHDKWSKEITSVVLEFEPLQELRVGRIFKEFAKFSGYELLLTNHDLIEEGKRMSHCVGTYTSNVNTGNCGIYRVNGYTLEVRVSKPYLKEEVAALSLVGETHKISMIQFRGFKNSNAPSDLIFEVESVLSDFSKDGIKKYQDNTIDEKQSINIFDDFLF